MFTVHIKNRAPETGFNPEPESRHKTEDAAIEAASALASDPKSYGRTVLIQEEGTNLALTVEYCTGEPSIAYDDGEPRLVPSADQHYKVVRDPREEKVEIRTETDPDTGATTVTFDQPKGHPLVGDLTETIIKIEAAS